MPRKHSRDAHMLKTWTTNEISLKCDTKLMIAVARLLYMTCHAMPSMIYYAILQHLPLQDCKVYNFAFSFRPSKFTCAALTGLVTA